MGAEASNLPRILALLRKEKKISQKQVAKDLGVSQALLSHYEKGIRNPGLDFLVRCADYYQVSCDYLLGRTPHRSGQTLTMKDIPHPESEGKTNHGIGSVLTQLNKKLIANSLNILFDLLTKLGNKDLTNQLSTFLMIAVYKAFRAVYASNPKNQQEIFSLPKQVYSSYADAQMQISYARALAIAEDSPVGVDSRLKSPTAVSISTESLGKDYPLFAPSLLNLVQNAEKRSSYPSVDDNR